MDKMKHAVHVFPGQCDRAHLERARRNRYMPLSRLAQMNQCLRLQLSGQRQMKPKLFIDVRVTPFNQQHLLPSGQSGRAPSRQLNFPRSAPIAVQFADTGKRQLRQTGHIALGHKAQKPTNAGQPKPAQYNRRSRRCQLSHVLIQGLNRPAFGQPKRRLQCSVKAVLTGSVRSLAQSRHRQLLDGPTCGKVPSKPSRAKSSKVGIVGDIINPISLKV